MKQIIDEIRADRKWMSPRGLLESLSDVVIFGTGGAAKSATDLLVSYDVNVLYYVDNDERKHGGVFNNKPVLCPEILKNDKQVVLIASCWAKDIAQQLKAYGVKYYDVSYFVDFPRWSGHFDCNIFDVDRAIEFACEYLDGDDLDSYLGCIRYRQTYDPIYLLTPQFEHYMNVHTLPSAADVYIDGGAWQGDTVVELNKRYNAALDIHCFEPDENNFKILCDLIGAEHYNNVHLNKLALWSENATLTFASSEDVVHTMQSRVVESVGQQKTVSISAVSLDGYSDENNIKPNYIKLDVEGSELMVLAGSRGVIGKYRPKLAISAYHEPNHLWQVIDAIVNIKPSYKFFFTHHSQQLFESVVYAISECEMD